MSKDPGRLKPHKRYFGTDGIRGRVGEEPVTPEFVLKLGWAAGRVFANRFRDGRTRQSILIGKDTRLSGYMFESALEAGLAAAGVDVLLVGPMPTPAVAYLTRTFRCLAGVVISASHNPYYDNGIKFFSGRGEKLDDEVEADIEAHINLPVSLVAPHEIGRASRIVDAAGRYIEFCKSCFPSRYGLQGLKLVVDCAEGATYHLAPHVFRELGAEVVESGVEPNGLNINDGVGATEPAGLVKLVLEHSADLGIAFDGDGDRVIMVDHKGEVVDGDELLFIVARDRQRSKRLNGGLVGTLMTNYGLESAMQDMSIPFVRADVGDRHVLKELVARNWQLGGEASGHIICLDKTTTGDGIVSALQVLAALVARQESLHDCKQQMTKFPQARVNVSCNSRKMANSRQVKAAVKQAEVELGGRGRVLVRPSGTEPLIRIMVEGRDLHQAAQLAKQLADEVEQSLA